MRRYNYEKQVEKWDVLEVTVEGHSDKNPFVDYEIQGIFTGKHETVTVDGFYDGEGVYKVRYMPSFVELYTFEERDRRGSAHREISGNTGERGKSRTDPRGKYLSFCLRRRNAVLFHRHNLLCVGRARFQMLQSKGILPLKKRRHCFYVKNITESNGTF